MDFGLVSLESLVSSHEDSGTGTNGGGGGVPSQLNDSETKPKGLGSGFVKQERSGLGEDDWKSSKVAKTVDLSSSKTMPLHHGTPLLRSNSLFHADTRQQEHMLSFSSSKSEFSLLSKEGGVVERSAQNSAFPYYQRAPPSYSRNAGMCIFSSMCFFQKKKKIMVVGLSELIFGFWMVMDLVRWGFGDFEGKLRLRPFLFLFFK